VLKLDYLYLLERELKKEVFSDQSSILKLGRLQVTEYKDVMQVYKFHFKICSQGLVPGVNSMSQPLKTIKEHNLRLTSSQDSCENLLSLIKSIWDFVLATLSGGWT